ncbi:MAG: hypothetical protein ACTSWW_02920 [Promethearchaeota archaeon]
MKGSPPSLLIKGKSLSITKPWLFIHGDYGAEEIMTLPAQLIDWKKWIPRIFSENDVFLDFFSQFYTQTKKFPAFSKNSFDNLWETAFSTFQNLSKTNKVYLNLQKIENVISERSELQQNIDRLLQFEKQLEKFAENSLFQSKQDLVKKLKINLTKLQPSYEIQRDEFFVHNTQMEQMKNDQKSFKIQQNRLKQIQRDFFRQTNALTKQMDEFDPKMQIYLDKLNGIDLDQNSADFIRIDQKYKNLHVKYEILKDERSVIMQKSKVTSKALKDLRNQFKTINQQYREFKASYSVIHTRFSEIDSQISGLKSQIASIEQELQEMISVKEKHTGSEEIDPDFDHIPFSTPDQARMVIQQHKSRLTLIDHKLTDIFHTTNLTKIHKLMEEKHQVIAKKLLGFHTTLETLNTKTILSTMFQELFLFLKKLEETMNHLLRPFELHVRLEFSQTSSDLTTFDTQISIFQKNQKLESNSDLNRVHRAYFYYAFIIAAYQAADLPVVPISLDYLPSFMKTKQTFQKSTTILKDTLSQLPSASNTKVVFFIFEESYDVSPIIFVKPSLHETDLPTPPRSKGVTPHPSIIVPSYLMEANQVFAHISYFSIKKDLIEALRKGGVPESDIIPTINHFTITKQLNYSRKKPRGYHYIQEGAENPILTSKSKPKKELTVELRNKLEKLFQTTPLFTSKAKYLAALKERFKNQTEFTPENLFTLFKNNGLIHYSRSAPRGYSYSKK